MSAIPAEMVVTTAVTVLTGLVVTALYRKVEGFVERERGRSERIEGKLDVMTKALASVMRSDLIHKSQKYIYQIKHATPEEKSSWHAEWQQYKGLGADGYIDLMAERVMSLPEVPEGGDSDG